MDILSFDSFKLIRLNSFRKTNVPTAAQGKKNVLTFSGCEKQGEEALLYPESAGRAPGITLIQH
jgi:hypothetical protein